MSILALWLVATTIPALAYPLPFTSPLTTQTWFLATYGLYADVHASIETDKDVAKVHANAELFDPRAEHVFTYLQVFSAMCVMFAHGAGQCAHGGLLCRSEMAVR